MCGRQEVKLHDLMEAATEFRSCVRAETAQVAVLGSLSLIVRTVSVDVKQQ